MSKLISGLVSSLFVVSILSGCSGNSAPVMTIDPSIITASSVEAEKPVRPVFNKRKLNLVPTVGSTASALNIPTNSVNEQKKKQLKLHTYFFKCYSNGATSYAASATNEHMKMLTKAATATGLKLDANGDGAITFDEISKFVTSDTYVKYFRESWISFSYNKLDSNTDKKLSVDEFNQFNAKVKAPELPDYQLLEEFSEYDYNSNRSVELEEYEDFFMEYLLTKYGIN